MPCEAMTHNWQVHSRTIVLHQGHPLHLNLGSDSSTMKAPQAISSSDHVTKFCSHSYSKQSGGCLSTALPISPNFRLPPADIHLFPYPQYRVLSQRLDTRWRWVLGPCDRISIRVRILTVVPWLPPTISAPVIHGVTLPFGHESQRSNTDNHWVPCSNHPTTWSPVGRSP